MYLSQFVFLFIFGFLPMDYKYNFSSSQCWLFKNIAKEKTLPFHCSWYSILTKLCCKAFSPFEYFELVLGFSFIFCTCILFHLNQYQASSTFKQKELLGTFILKQCFPSHVPKSCLSVVLKITAVTVLQGESKNRFMMK